MQEGGPRDRGQCYGEIMEARDLRVVASAEGPKHATTGLVASGRADASRLERRAPAGALSVKCDRPSKIMTAAIRAGPPAASQRRLARRGRAPVRRRASSARGPPSHPLGEALGHDFEPPPQGRSGVRTQQA